MKRRCFEKHESWLVKVYVRKRSSDLHDCWYCPMKIHPDQPYIEVRRADGVVERYHVDCFNSVYRGTSLRLVAVNTPRGVVLCEA